MAGGNEPGKRWRNEALRWWIFFSAPVLRWPDHFGTIVVSIFDPVGIHPIQNRDGVVAQRALGQLRHPTGRRGEIGGNPQADQIVQGLLPGCCLPQTSITLHSVKAASLEG
jgi:hypothetical protein